MDITIRHGLQFLISLSVLFLFAQKSWAEPKLTPDKVQVRFNQLYIAQGFDSNDNVQIVGEGRYLDGCYRNAETKVKVDHKNKKIHLIPYAYKYNGLCIKVILPFDRVINIGILKAGTYTITQGEQAEEIGKIEAKPAVTNVPDDFIYAPVSQAYFRNLGTTNTVSLSGEFSNSCMKLKEVKFDIQPQVLVVQPISELTESATCVEGSFPFEGDTEVGPMKPGRYLLHVRSMNGKAVNNLVDVR